METTPGAHPLAAHKTRLVERWQSAQRREDHGSRGLEHNARPLEKPFLAERQDGQPPARPLLQPKDWNAAERTRTEGTAVRFQSAQGTIRLHGERRGAGCGVRRIA